MGPKLINSRQVGHDAPEITHLLVGAVLRLLLGVVMLGMHVELHGVNFEGLPVTYPLLATTGLVFFGELKPTLSGPLRGVVKKSWGEHDVVGKPCPTVALSLGNICTVVLGVYPHCRA